jgi:hypothetical protein
MPPRETTFVTTGLPIVRVPVLSNTTEFTIENFSRTFPPRKSSPLVAPNEVPTWKERKNIEAHGQSKPNN